MSNSAYTSNISYAPYNIGLILIILGISVAMFFAVEVFNFINSKKALEVKKNEQI